VGKDRDPELSV